LFLHSRREQDFADEFESNIAFHVEDNVRAGMLPEEARRQALLRFGGIEHAKQDCRDRLGLPLLETFLYDLRYAARSLARSRLFAVVTVATLAFGIGASTTMFTVVQAVLLRPLPYAEPGRLVAISEVDRLKPSTGSNVASADFFEWRRVSTFFSDMADYVGIDERGKARVDLYLTGTGETRILKGLDVTGNLFGVLGVAPALGRGFAGNEDHVAILTHNCWQTRFAGDPHIIGQSVKLNGERTDVIGVMPRGFFFPNNEIEVFITPGDFTPDRVFHDAGVVARLAPGISLQQASAQMATIGLRLKQAYPETNATLDPRVEMFHSALASTSRPALLLLFSAVGILFLIVCSNVAHLQLGRAASRVHEFTIRKALGASRGRLVRQLLTESLVLSGLGGLAGFILAGAGRAALLQFAPEAIPSYADLRIDTQVILFNLTITLLAPLLFGIGPALSTALGGGLGNRSESQPYSKRSARRFMVGAEVALSVVLVICAGLLVRSFVRLEEVDLGFRTEHTLSFRVDLGDLVATEDQRAREYAEMEKQLLEQRGVDAVGATARPVLGGGAGGETTANIQGRERILRLELVTPGYFLAMRTPLLEGRLLNQADTRTSAPVAVVNSAFEHLYFPDKNAVGKHIGLGTPSTAIVGVVADLKQERIDQPAQPAAFVPSTQIVPRGVTFFVRGRADRGALLSAARRAVHAVDPVVPLANVATLDELVQASLSGQRVRTMLLSLTAGAALFLAALGLYGVLAYSVVQRSAEIGIRIALGATGRQLFRMIVLDGMRPVVIGAAFGFAAALAASGLIRSFLFETVPTDPPTYLSTVLILAAVSVCACAIPAMKAIRVDPVVSLRRE
jgi:predicted permease